MSHLGYGAYDAKKEKDGNDAVYTTLNFYGNHDEPRHFAKEVYNYLLNKGYTDINLSIKYFEEDDREIMSSIIINYPHYQQHISIRGKLCYHYPPSPRMREMLGVCYPAQYKHLRERLSNL